jgi:hypothetical protein
MSFRRILIGLLTLWLGLMGIAFGMLFLLCVSLFLFWQGLSVSVIAFGLLCLSCFVLAGMVLWRSGSKQRRKLTDAEEPIYLSEGDGQPYDTPSRFRNATGHSKR